MPQIPIITPLIVLGLVFGSALKSKSRGISKKKLASASLAAGVLNSIHAYLLYLLTPTRLAVPFAGIPTTSATAIEGFASTSEVSFVGASFLAAFLMVFLVLGVAMAYARVGRGEELREAEEVTPEEATLTAS